MRAMVLQAVDGPLLEVERPLPSPGPGELRLRIEACGVCRTDLHLLDGELPQARLPVVPGHEIVGIVDAVGNDCRHRPGERVGVPWLGNTCGHCRHCLADHENLCDTPEFTGCSRDGGYATHVLARDAFCLPLPQERFPDPVAAAPLLCAGLIGWRALRAAGDDARSIGLYGFGAAAHVLAQVCAWQGRQTYAFTRPGDHAAQQFARRLGAVWAGDSDRPPPQPLDAAIVFAAVGALVPRALAAVGKGGRVVCAGIHMSTIPAFPYALLWQERHLQSVANLTRRDGIGFLRVAADAGVATHTTAYPLGEANRALDDLRHGRFVGAAVLVP